MPETIACFKIVQNKLHDAASGHTAAEIVFDRANAELPFMGLTVFEVFFLALVEVDGENTHAVYLKKLFREPPDFAAQGVIYSLAELKEDAERTYLRKIYYADRGGAEMDKREALVLARQYASIVSQELNPDRIILYGSHA